MAALQPPSHRPAWGGLRGKKNDDFSRCPKDDQKSYIWKAWNKPSEAAVDRTCYPGMR